MTDLAVSERGNISGDDRKNKRTQDMKKILKTAVITLVILAALTAGAAMILHK